MKKGYIKQKITNLQALAKQKTKKVLLNIKVRQLNKKHLQ